MIDIEKAIISQYGNSSAMGKLIFNMNEYIRPDADIDTFYSYIWDVDTAQGFGLDILGRIVDVSRDILTNPVDSLSDTAFRQLVLLKALSNISASNAPSINQLLSNWMAGRGRCYVADLGGMQMSYVFEFELEPFEIEILLQGGIFLRPAGVGGIIINATFPVFGFSEAGTYTAAPFNQAPFIPIGAVHAIS